MCTDGMYLGDLSSVSASTSPFWCLDRSCLLLVRRSLSVIGLSMVGIKHVMRQLFQTIYIRRLTSRGSTNN